MDVDEMDLDLEIEREMEMEIEHLEPIDTDTDLPTQVEVELEALEFNPTRHAYIDRTRLSMCLNNQHLFEHLGRTKGKSRSNAKELADLKTGSDRQKAYVKTLFKMFDLSDNPDSTMETTFASRPSAVLEISQPQLQVEPNSRRSKSKKKDKKVKVEMARHYSNHGGSCLQCCDGTIARVLTNGYYTDVDIANCAPTIFVNLA